MAAASPTAIEHNENLETFCIMWLDAAVNNSRENVKAQEQLKTIIDHLLTFDDDQQCFHYIKNLSDDDRVILVVSGRFGRIIVPKIANMHKIASIYVYCFDKQANQQWAQQFVKVKYVVTRLDELIQHIRKDYTQQQFDRIDDPLLIKAFHDRQTTKNLYEEFLYSQLLIDCLIRMATPSNDQQELIDFCKKYYRKNYTEIMNIKEFETKYSSEKALWWYTRHFFLSRLLNRALYKQDINLLFLFRVFIRDIASQLTKFECLSTIRAYRSQLISKDIFQVLSSSVGKFISINTFLSANTNEHKARSILNVDNGSDTVKKVFFEIKARSNLQNVRPFNNIEQHSYCSDGNDVLFMAGSIFRIDKLKSSDHEIWTVQMSLHSINDLELKPLFENMKEALGIGRTSLFELSHILQQMQKLKDAEKCYRRYLNQLPIDHPHITKCYHAFGKIAELEKNFTSSLKWYERSLQIFLQMQKSDDIFIAGLYNDIGTVYLKTHDYIKALKMFGKSLKYWGKVDDKNYLRIVQCLNQSGFVYEMKKKYSEALQHYQRALDILQTYHFDRHPDIAVANQNIARVYELNGEYQKALKAYEKAFEIFRYSLPSTKIYVNEIEKSIRQVSSKIK